MALLGLFGKKLQKLSSNSKSTTKTNSFGERMDRLTPDCELPYGWSYANMGFTEKIKSEYRHLGDAYYASKGKDVLKEYAALKSLVVYMQDARKLCASQGECFLFWFSNILTSPNHLSELQERLKYLEANMDELIRQENMLKSLRADLKKIIRAEPGVIQASLYKRFSPELKPHISNELYLMEANGIIERQKSGRSYALYMK